MVFIVWNPFLQNNNLYILQSKVFAGRASRAPELGDEVGGGAENPDGGPHRTVDHYGEVAAAYFARQLQYTDIS